MDEDRLLMSVAELKHVRDCLKFQLPFEDREIEWIMKKLSPKSPRETDETKDDTVNTPPKDEKPSTSGIIDFHDSPLPVKNAIQKVPSKEIFETQKKENPPSEEAPHPLL